MTYLLRRALPALLLLVALPAPAAVAQTTSTTAAPVSGETLLRLDQRTARGLARNRV